MAYRREIMKILHFLILTSMFLVSAFFLITGCEYDVAEPPWETEDFVMPGINPLITSINPPEGVPGVNVITIIGQNFDVVPDSNIFLETNETFGIEPEVIEKTQTSVTIRRPNLVTDSLFVKVWRDSGLVDRFGPYKIASVYEVFGAFFENHALGAITADNSGNIYVAEGLAPFPVYKISSGGTQTLLVDTLPTATPLSASSAPSEAIIGADGYLYLLRINRMIQRVNTETGEVTSWHRYSASSRNQLRNGDFDDAGYLYTGGVGTDLVIIASDSTSRTSGLYVSASSGADTIFAVKVHNNYLYLSVGGAEGRAVWRHSLDGSGNLGAKELVFDVSANSVFSSRLVTGIAFSNDGKMFLTTDAPDPLIVTEGENADYFYKNILPPYAKKTVALNNYLYLIIGNTAPAQNYMVYRVDTGSSMAP
jgi:hypothetical protein